MLLDEQIATFEERLDQAQRCFGEPQRDWELLIARLHDLCWLATDLHFAFGEERCPNSSSAEEALDAIQRYLELTRRVLATVSLPHVYAEKVQEFVRHNESRIKWMQDAMLERQQIRAALNSR